MEYRSRYDVINGIRYTGLNFKEVSEFADGRLAWNSKEMDWADGFPPEDLDVVLRGEIPQHLKHGDYVVKLNNGSYMTLDELTFEALFEGIKDNGK